MVTSGFDPSGPGALPGHASSRVTDPVGPQPTRAHPPAFFFFCCEPTGHALPLIAFSFGVGSCLILSLSLEFLLGACPAAEGDRCVEPEPGNLLARISSPITLRPEVLRTREAVVGSLSADAFLTGFNGERDRCLAFSDNPEACVDLAFQNAGGLRDETRCGLRSEWREGALYQRDLEQLMPFENPMQAIYVQGDDLLAGMEESVSLLGEPGRFAKNGAFLHLAGAAVLVDCGGKARMVTGQNEVVEPGARVLGMCLRHWSAGPNLLLLIENF